MNEACDTVERTVPLARDGKFLKGRDLLPWWRGTELLLIVSFEPFETLCVEVSSGSTCAASVSSPPFRAARLRACVAPVPIPGRKDRYLVLTREEAQAQDRVVHVHRFVQLDAREGVSAASRPFYFERLEVERASGLCDLGDGKLLVIYERNDREARWAELAWSAVLEQF
jgi:hypothetical protein